ncbi:uncharacterized protein AC631_05748 [Debaryomyces fabryi]|uniref:C2H2-type domain-containing protein n=1 Tax=Debaryomyces fabryi TaxID=58627 RepID=A0A0V1PQG2_9ASCO|nr:uncharacterized protein AC631_05748 [Debaryomyces fabryi]KRZ98492.1 hypothetical protein AC631_05748 [Debaryomyces fabryi]CUM50849.1 unnamed protein product [Debaryomyces fabryi]
MQYTCNSCNLAFPSPEDQRVHMKSDWHRYNLKRRVAQLPPIDEDLFNSKVSSLSITESGADNVNEEKTKNRTQLTKKEIRRREKETLQAKKRQILETAKEAMISKMKEQDRDSNSPSESIQENELISTEDTKLDDNKPETSNEITPEQQEELLMKEKLSNKVEIPVTTCLFCHSKQKSNFEDIESNVKHMFVKHGLYIPERKYLVDMEGLIKYLGEKIGLGNICLCCSYQGKNIEAVREHMLIKRHMRLPYETEDEKLEVSEFYDFSSTYDGSIDDKSVNEEDWEDISDNEDQEDGESDEELSPADNALYPNGHELVLPSGAVVGHRSLARYYRQNLAPERVLSEGQGTVIAAETRHMLNIKDREVLATQKRAWGREKKREDINDRRAAKFVNNQPYYRDQLLQ